MIKPIKVNDSNPNYQYSVCTLVTKKNEYLGMVDSFVKQGFNEKNTEFLFIDNSDSNNFEAYSGLNHLLNIAAGKYVILCHQDVVLMYDDESTLQKRLCELDGIDDSWALAGNAGGINLRNLAIRITDLHDTFSRGNFPEKVLSLDENFIIVNRKNRVAFSGNLSGFHLYGADICILADILGYNSYVVDFHLKHNSKGVITSDFLQNRQALISKYQSVFKSKFISTTCTRFFISSSKTLNYFLNTKHVLNVIRSIYTKR